VEECACPLVTLLGACGVRKPWVASVLAKERVQTGGFCDGHCLGSTKAPGSLSVGASISLKICQILDCSRFFAQSKSSGVRSLAVKKSAH
jgi:hypothetical protein